MKAHLYLDILPQPDNSTCGPTCLHAVYRYFEDTLSLQELIAEVRRLEEGGTLAVYLASHALQRGYQTTIFSFNLPIFDPTWSAAAPTEIAEKLRRQLVFKRDIPGFETATRAYLEYLELGGRLRFEVLTAGLIRKYLKKSIPILSGLSATYLYNSAREYSVGTELVYDDVRGQSMGHFVVLAGYDRAEGSVLVADPLMPNPVAPSQYYRVNIYRLVCAIMLGTLTYDGDLLVIQPGKLKNQV
ncbi:MAG: hypothetical protein JSW39_03430 [Desulfobacterales bacterium]|nr:MAG: hypothetical protein JSW39_03430 [Desulfobacterales bacterium]